MLKKERVKIIIDEEGNPSIDILNATGPSCAKDAAEWAALSGGGANVSKKAEYFKTEKKPTNVQTQKG